MLEAVGLSTSSVAAWEPIDEPDEPAETFAGNARAKARHYARATGRWCLADDSGLEVDALNGAPGVRSARYGADRWPAGADRPARDRANTAKLLDALAGVPTEERTGRFVCHLALAAPDGRVLLEARGTLEGRIAAPAGENGFGYDPVFLLPDRGCTAAELSAEQKNAISHRGAALRELARTLPALLDDA